jgi:hypothetical protein
MDDAPVTVMAGRRAGDHYPMRGQDEQMRGNCDHGLARPGITARHRAVDGRRIVACLLLAMLLLEPACFFRKKRAAEPRYPAAPVRCALLPLNVPPENPQLRWAAFAATYLMARFADQAQDLSAAALWETIPVALESVGDSRSITPDTAAYVASRVTARWAIQGALLAVKGGMRLRLDFLPSETSMVAYRYESSFTPETMLQKMREAFEQFLTYLMARPLPKSSDAISPGNLRQIGEALDQEYGWYRTADPGKAERVVAELAKSQLSVARILFSPTVYPILAPPADRPSNAHPKPQAPSAAGW